MIILNFNYFSEQGRCHQDRVQSLEPF